MGIVHRSKLSKKKRKTRSKALPQELDGGFILGFIIGAFIFLASGSFLLSFLPVILIPFLVTLAKLETDTRTPEKHTQTEEERIKALKRIERVQQQVKVTIISQGTPAKEAKQAHSTEITDQLLPLLEVDKIL